MASSWSCSEHLEDVLYVLPCLANLYNGCIHSGCIRPGWSKALKIKRSQRCSSSGEILLIKGHIKNILPQGHRETWKSILNEQYGFRIGRLSSARLLDVNWLNTACYARSGVSIWRYLMLFELRFCFKRWNTAETYSGRAISSLQSFAAKTRVRWMLLNMRPFYKQQSVLRKITWVEYSYIGRDFGLYRLTMFK